MATIEVEGKRYKVTENLGYQGGHYVKAVATPDGGERMAVRRNFAWTWWTSRDRVQTGGPCVGQSANVTARRGIPRPSPSDCAGDTR